MTKEIPQHVIDHVKRLTEKEGESIAKMYLARILNVKKSQKNEWYRKIMAGYTAPSVQQEKESFEERKTAKAVYSGLTGVAESVDENVKTLEDLLKVCRVDLSIWEVEKYIVNKWGTASRNELLGGMTVQPIYQVKAWLKRKIEASNFKNLLDLFIKQTAEYAPSTFKIQPQNKDRDCLYLLNIQDLHLAKMAWGKETGGKDYDIKIAEHVYNEAVADLMKKVPQHRIEEVVIIVGSDLFQIDDDKSSTTAGTYVDSDTRTFKAFEIGAKMIASIAEKLAEKFRVRMIVIPGNHDANISQYLGYYLSAWFRAHINIEIDNEPKSRKYLGYGKNLIGFDHGDNVKLTDLPLIMMRENQDTISQYKFFEILSGHLHHESVDEYKGVKVRVAPALCAPDKWHAKHGYIGSLRNSQGLLYNREEGLEAIYYSKSLD
jgi:hypothetical protein